MRAYAPAIAQGEGRSLGEWRIGVFSLRPLTIHQQRQHCKITIVSLLKSGSDHPISMYGPVHSLLGGSKCSCPLPQKYSELLPPKFAQPPACLVPYLPQQAAMNSKALSSPKHFLVCHHPPSDSLIINFLRQKQKHFPERKNTLK
jgi:hypothetical protein